ncbi:MAG: hypothetical protein R3F17_14020 [Planctomycetota bacterium]
MVGVEQGERIETDNGGIVRARYRMFDGLKHGAALMYGPKGSCPAGAVRVRASGRRLTYFKGDEGMRRVGTFVGDKENGHWRFYYPSGDVEAEGPFCRGQAARRLGRVLRRWSPAFRRHLLSGGQRQRRLATHWPTGLLMSTGEMYGGMHNGYWNFYDEFGRA